MLDDSDLEATAHHQYENVVRKLAFRKDRLCLRPVGVASKYRSPIFLIRNFLAGVTIVIVEAQVSYYHCSRMFVLLRMKAMYSS